MDVDSRWYEDFFGDDRLDLAALRIADERTQAEVDFVVGALDLDQGARMLDLACGHGRHSLELARRGYRVTGLDLSAPSLDVARTRAHDGTLEVEFGAAMLSDAGLELERAYGGFDGSELGLDSRRLIVLARKR